MAGTPRWRGAPCLAASFAGSNRPVTPDQGNLKVSSSLNRLERRYRRDQEAVMNSKHSEDVMFETTATFALLVAGIAIAALLYQLITAIVPIVESMVFPKMIAASSQEGTPGAPTRTLAVVLAHADDETPVGPILARYGREGVQ